MARRQRTYRAEYERRLSRARAQHLPTAVARGHGIVPKRIAVGIERQREGGKALPVKTQEKYRRQIGQYERKYWGEIETGRVLTVRRRERRVARTFASPEEAREYLEEQGMPTTPTYVRLIEQEGRWRVYTLR